jgi:hypothetical protein
MQTEESVNLAIELLFKKISQTLAQPQIPFVETAVETPVAAPEVAPVEIPAEAPVQAPIETPIEMPAVAAAPAIVEAPVEIAAAKVSDFMEIQTETAPVAIAPAEPLVEIMTAEISPLLMDAPLEVETPATAAAEIAPVEIAAVTIPEPAPDRTAEVSSAPLAPAASCDFLQALESISPTAEIAPAPKKRKPLREKKSSRIAYAFTTLAYAAAFIVCSFIASEFRNYVLPPKGSVPVFSSQISQIQLNSLKRENADLQSKLETARAENASLQAKIATLAQKAPKEVIRVITKEVPKVVPRDEIESPVAHVCVNLGNDPFNLYVSYLHRETLKGNICSNMKQVTYLKRYIDTHSVATNDVCIYAWKQIEKASVRCATSAETKASARSKVGG